LRAENTKHRADSIPTMDSISQAAKEITRERKKESF